jgi:elongator complex protein 2
MLKRRIHATQDETHRGIYATLAGHPSNVTKVRFLPSGHSRPAVVSGDDSGHLTVWTPNGSDDVPGPSFSLAASFKGHSQSVSALAVLPRSEDGAVQPLLVTGGSDGLVKVWDVSALQGKAGKQPELLQTIDFGGKLPLELALSRLPGSRGESCRR